MNGKLRKFLPLIFLIVIIAAPMIAIFGWSDEFSNFTGISHDTGGCHDGAIVCQTGWIVASTSSGEGVLPGETFTIDVQIFRFALAVNDDITVGFISYRGDNSEFVYIDKTYHEDNVTLDATGNSSVIQFTATAPSTLGSYTLIIDALESNGGILNWLTGTLNITVAGIVTQGPTLQPLTRIGAHVSLSWNTVTNASIYYIYRDTSTITSVVGLTPVAVTSDTSQSDTTPGEGDYYYATLAGNVHGNGTVSNSESISIPDLGVGPTHELILYVVGAICAICAIVALITIVRRK